MSLNLKSAQDFIVFLSGDMKNMVTHGDELAYIFDLNDIYGNSLESNNVPLSEEDQRVRDIFTQMVADFAKGGKVHLEEREVQPFSSKSNNFIQIKPKPVLASDFKYCEMALWCNIAERLKSTTCSFLKAFNTQIQNVEKVFGAVLGTNILDNNNSGLSNILGSGLNNQKSAVSNNQNPLGALFGGNSQQLSKPSQSGKLNLPGIGGILIG